MHNEAFADLNKVLRRYLKPDRLMIDDFGIKQLPKRSGEYLFETVMRRFGIPIGAFGQTAVLPSCAALSSTDRP